MSSPPRLTVARAQGLRRRWDRQQELYVPDRERRFDTMLLWLRTVAGSRPRVLDLGSGTGAITERVLRALPRARVVAIDWDPVTRRIAEVGLSRLPGRVTWVDADLRTPTWVRAIPPGRYDAALSSTALHWLNGSQLAGLYRSLAARLRRGGIFLNSDGMDFDRRSRRIRQGSEAVRAYLLAQARRRPPDNRAWLGWWAAVERDPALREEFRVHRLRFPSDHGDVRTLDLPGHLRALRAAGFREAEVVYSRRTSRVVAAIR